MNFLIFAPLAPRSTQARSAQAMLDALRQAGHEATLVRSENVYGAETAQQAGWRDEALVRSLAAQADVVVYLLGDDARHDAGARSWLPHLPGVLWLCGRNGQEMARAYGPRALGILAGEAADLASLMRSCPGPVLGAGGNEAPAVLVRLGREAQRALPLRAAADTLAATLRNWGADDETIGSCGLARSFDIFEAADESGR